MSNNIVSDSAIKSLKPVLNELADSLIGNDLTHTALTPKQRAFLKARSNYAHDDKYGDSLARKETHISRPSLYRWKTKDPNFLTLYNKSLILSEQTDISIRDYIISHADKAAKELIELINIPWKTSDRTIQVKYQTCLKILEEAGYFKQTQQPIVKLQFGDIRIAGREQKYLPSA